MGVKKFRQRVSAPRLVSNKERVTKYQRYLYDYSALGGGTGAKTLTDADGGTQTIPDNAVVLRCIQETVTTLGAAAGTPTVKLGITGNDDAFVGATNYNEAGMVTEIITSRASELPLKINNSSGVSVLATIASNSLNAGKFYLWIEYLEGA